MEAHVRIFDTTLRDGEQSPGCSLTRTEKLEVARQLARLGVDVIEAGFPAASPGAIAPARHRRIHTFLATSDVHLQHKLRMTRAQVLDTVSRMVELARTVCDDVEFSPEDASRTEPAF